MDQANVIYQRTASTDAELAVRLRRGDAAAFRTLMQRYNQRLFRMARGVLGDSADAEDAVQEAYVLAFTPGLFSSVLSGCGVAQSGSIWWVR